jgi:tetratricopeptide (TPR) repeat protein
MQVANQARRHEDARALAGKLAAIRPWNPNYRIDVALADARLGRKDAAFAEADDVVALYPWDGGLRGWRGAVHVVLGDVDGAIEDLTWALDHGATPPGWALDNAGIPPRK